MLDRLRGIFIYAIAIVLPLAGLALTGVRVLEKDGEEALRVGAATLLGVVIYALAFG